MSAADNPGVLLSQQRVNAANAAAYEIEVSAMALRRLIDDKDGLGDLHPLMRGFVARVVALTSAIAHALDEEHRDQAAVENTVYVSDVVKLVNRS